MEPAPQTDMERKKEQEHSSWWAGALGLGIAGRFYNSGNERGEILAAVSGWALILGLLRECVVLCATLCQDRWRGPSKCIHGSLEIADIAEAGKGFVSCSLFYPWRTMWPTYSCAILTTTWFKNQEAVCFVHYSNLNVCSVENEVHFGFVPDHPGILISWSSSSKI